MFLSLLLLSIAGGGAAAAFVIELIVEFTAVRRARADASRILRANAVVFNLILLYTTPEPHQSAKDQQIKDQQIKAFDTSTRVNVKCEMRKNIGERGFIESSNHCVIVVPSRPPSPEQLPIAEPLPKRTSVLRYSHTWRPTRRTCQRGICYHHVRVQRRW